MNNFAAALQSLTGRVAFAFKDHGGSNDDDDDDGEGGNGTIGGRGLGVITGEDDTGEEGLAQTDGARPFWSGKVGKEALAAIAVSGFVIVGGAAVISRGGSGAAAAASPLALEPWVPTAISVRHRRLLDAGGSPEGVDDADISPSKFDWRLLEAGPLEAGGVEDGNAGTILPEGSLEIIDVTISAERSDDKRSDDEDEDTVTLVWNDPLQDEAKLTVFFRNTYPVDLTEVVIQDSRSGVVCEPNLPANSGFTCGSTFILGDLERLGGNFTTEVFATARYGDHIISSPAFEQMYQVVQPKPSLSIKSLVNDEKLALIDPGESANQTYTVTNTGNVPLKVTDMKDLRYAPKFACDWTNLVLRPEESKTCEQVVNIYPRTVFFRGEVTAEFVTRYGEEPVQVIATDEGSQYDSHKMRLHEGGKYFFVIENLLMWEDGRIACQEYAGFDLAKIETESENDFAKSLCPVMLGLGYTECNIGLYKTEGGIWKWVADGTTVGNIGKFGESYGWVEYFTEVWDFSGTARKCTTMLEGKWRSWPCNAGTSYKRSSICSSTFATST